MKMAGAPTGETWWPSSRHSNKKKTSVADAEEEVVDLHDVLQSSRRTAKTEFSQGLVVTLIDAGCEHAKAKTDMALMEDLIAMQGTYHLVAFVDGSPVFRQELEDDPASGLFIWHASMPGVQGWYISTEWLSSKICFEDRVANGGVLAYFKGLSYQAPCEVESQQALHCLLGKKKKRRALFELKLQGLFEFQEKMINDLM